MPSKIKISIPLPCHENWQDMAPVDKGRFCASCQKTVTDFTNASDREIAAALKTSNMCGKFRANQLERGLIIPGEKPSVWMAAGVAAITILTIGNNALSAQTPINTEQTENRTDDIKARKVEIKRLITGTASDSEGPLPGVIVMIKDKPETAASSDIEGRFEIEAGTGDILVFSYISMEAIFVTVTDDNQYSVVLPETFEKVIVGGLTVHRTFFSRIFHNIGNIFR